MNATPDTRSHRGLGEQLAELASDFTRISEAVRGPQTCGRVIAALRDVQGETIAFLLEPVSDQNEPGPMTGVCEGFPLDHAQLRAPQRLRTRKAWIPQLAIELGHEL